MIARHWRGWTQNQDADSYELLLRDTILPRLRSIPGYCGGYVLRSDGADEVEFVVINFFDSFAAIEQFAGPITMWRCSSPRLGSSFSGLS